MVAVSCFIHALWRVGTGFALSGETREKLRPYIIRYAQTLGVTVHAVGGTDDHLHVLFDLPLNKTLDSINGELQKTTTRFLREVQNVKSFQWDSGTLSSVTPDDADWVATYVTENATRHTTGEIAPEWEGLAAEDGDEELPGWLQNVAGEA